MKPIERRISSRGPGVSSIPRTARLLTSVQGRLQAATGRKVSSKEIARAAGMPTTTYSKAANGGVELVQLERFLRILEIFPDDSWIDEIRRVLNKKDVSSDDQSHSLPSGDHVTRPSSPTS